MPPPLQHPPAVNPEWFFSSLAQSSAAIIGLIGAILITRIVDEIRRSRDERSRVLRVLAETRSAVMTAQSDFDNVARGGPGEIARRIREQVLPIYELPSEAIDENGIRSLAQRLEDARVSLEPLHKGQTRHSHGQAIGSINRFLEPFSRFRRNVSGAVNTFTAVAILLALFAGPGMIIPLACLPGEARTKALLLGAAGGGLIALGGYFALEIWRLNRLRVLHWRDSIYD